MEAVPVGQCRDGIDDPIADRRHAKLRSKVRWRGLGCGVDKAVVGWPSRDGRFRWAQRCVRTVVT
jgi:hypothetical protein